MRRLIIRPGAIGDFVVSLPALECLTDWLSRGLGRFRQRSAGTVCPPRPFHRIHRTRPARGSPMRRRACSTNCASFDSIVSWYGASRPDFREAVAALGAAVPLLPAPCPDRPGVHAVDFYLEQVTAAGACRSDGIPRIACGSRARRLRGDSPFFGQPEEELAARPVSGAGRAGSNAVMPVRWCAGPDDPPLRERGPHRQSV